MGEYCENIATLHNWNTRTNHSVPHALGDVANYILRDTFPDST